MIDLDELNQSELVLLAEEHDTEAHRGLSRAKLIAIIRGKGKPYPARQVNKVRLKIMDYIIEHWVQVEPLLSCPAMTGNPRACFQCTDIQVAECALTNKQTIFGKGKD